MALELLFPNFDKLIRTPEDVQRLNEAILQLAVQGKLVPQDPNDEPAGELLKRLNVSVAENSRTAKRTHAPTVVPSLPTGWALASSSAVCLSINDGDHLPPPKSETGIPFLVISNIRTGKLDFRNTRFVPEEYYEALRDERKPRRGDVLYSIVGSLGTAVLIEDDVQFCFQRHMALLRPGAAIISKYLLYLLQAPAILQQARATATGIAQLTIPMSGLRSLVFPLPPLAEQDRIVAKVDELFTQTRTLEAKLRQAQADVVTVNRAALHRLHTAQDEDQFQAAWRTIRDHFDVLYDDSRNVAELRQSILDLAVRGKLVPQDASDEPAEGLLTRIEAERERLVKERLISTEDVGKLQLDSTLDIPIAVLGEVRSGIQKSNARDPKDNPRRYITVAHVQRNRIDLGDPRYFEVSDEELEKWRLVSGDVLVIEGNGSSEQIGRAALFLGEIEDCVHQNHVIRVRPNREFILPQYLNLYLNSPPGRDQIFERSRTTSGLYNLSVGRIKTIVVPLPALSQQKRIVAKVDQLMRLCDELEAGLAQVETVRRSVTAAVLS